MMHFARSHRTICNFCENQNSSLLIVYKNIKFWPSCDGLLRKQRARYVNIIHRGVEQLQLTHMLSKYFPGSQVHAGWDTLSIFHSRDTSRERIIRFLQSWRPYPIVWFIDTRSALTAYCCVCTKAQMRTSRLYLLLPAKIRCFCFIIGRKGNIFGRSTVLLNLLSRWFPPSSWFTRYGVNVRQCLPPAAVWFPLVWINHLPRKGEPADKNLQEHSEPSY